MRKTSHNEGFSLIELMVTVAILAILTMIAAPNLSDFIRRNNVTSQTNELLGALQFARSTAVSRNVMVSICATTTAADSTPTCSNTNTLNTGWLVYTTTTASTAIATTDEVLRVFQGATNVSIQIKPSGTKVVTFDTRGSSVSGNLSFLVCAKKAADTVGQSGVRSAGRSVNLQSGGRAGSSPLGTDPAKAQALCTAT